MIAAALSLLPTAVEAGPKGTVNVRALGNKSLNMDGNLADWPLSAFTKVAQQPLFPEGQNAASTTANGDHLVFDNKRVGLFNGTAEDGFTADGINDFGASTYFAFDHKFLYILSVVIDNTLRDDLDVSAFGSTGFLNDGFEFFLDAKGDSTDCISDDAFPNVDGPDSSSPNTDDFQATVGLNVNFKPAGSGPNVLGARQTIERGGTLAMLGPVVDGVLDGAGKGGPGGTYRDALTASTASDGIADIGAMKYDDLRAAGALNPEILANPGVTFKGYVIEMRVPLRGRIIPDLNAERARVADSEQVVQPSTMGFDLFWRDVDGRVPDAEDDKSIKWADWAQSTTVTGCTGDPTPSNLFNTANWGQLVFDATKPLVPFPATTPKILFVTANAATLPNADADLMNFFDANGYQTVSFHSSGYALQPEQARAAIAGKALVFISETIGSTTMTDPANSGGAPLSLKDSDIPIVSNEAFIFDNAGWVTLPPDWTGGNDFIGWGNTARAEVYATGTDPGPLDALYIKMPGHPIANGLPAGKVQVFTKPYSFNFGLPSAEAYIIASVNADGTYPTQWGYDKGKKMSDGTTAPNKRICLFLGQVGTGRDLVEGDPGYDPAVPKRTPEANFPTDLGILNANGKKLLLNTLSYAAGVETVVTPIVISNVSVVQSSFTFSWTGGTGPFLIQYKDAIGNAWVDLMTTATRTASIPTVGVAGFFRVVGGTTKTVKLLKATLDPQQESATPPPSTGRGVGMVAVDGLNLTYFVSYEGLTSGVTLAHIHAGARGASGSPFIPFTPVVGTKSGTITGTFTLSAAQKTSVEAGGTYFNIHTQNFGGGEIRGQIEP